jgi:hypothetical protein
MNTIVPTEAKRSTPINGSPIVRRRSIPAKLANENETTLKTREL